MHFPPPRRPFTLPKCMHDASSIHSSKVHARRIIHSALTSASSKQYLSGLCSTFFLTVSATLQSTFTGSCAEGERYSLCIRRSKLNKQRSQQMAGARMNKLCQSKTHRNPRVDFLNGFGHQSLADAPQSLARLPESATNGTKIC